MRAVSGGGHTARTLSWLEELVDVDALTQVIIATHERDASLARFRGGSGSGGGPSDSRTRVDSATRHSGFLDHERAAAAVAAMKFPTQTPVFPDVALSEQERSRFEQLASGLVRDTLADYDIYSNEQQREVSARRWKAVKSRENVTVYKDRHYDPSNNVHRGLASNLAPSHPSAQSSRAASASSSSHAAPSALPASILESLPAEPWTLPQLLMVGTLSGSLDDVMYGLATPDVGLMLLKAHYARDEVIDGQVLAQIHGPTPAEPYRFLGLKWLVKGNPPAVSALVMPRDLTLLEATGILEHPVTGDRIGYFLMHSVRLPTCGTTETHKYAVRGRISSCYVFKELRPGVVDVYMKGFVEPSGAIADAVAVISAANGLLCCWRAVVCAQSKKLVWALRARRASKQSKRQAADGGSASSSQAQQPHRATSCRMCTKSLKRYSRVACCELCDAVVCSHCRVATKLAFASRSAKRVRLATVELCKGCVARTGQERTLDVAQREVRSGRFQSRPCSATGERAPVTSSASDDDGTSSSASTTRHSETSASSTARAILLAHAQDYAARSCDGSGRGDRSASARGASRTNEFSEAAHAATRAFNTSSSSASRGRTPEEQLMWTRMVQLQLQAERLYQLTKRNTDTLLLSSAMASMSTAPPSLPSRMSID